MLSGNISLASEVSSKFNEESRMKIDILMNAFEELGWDNQKDLTQNEIIHFLNNRTPQGEFDQTLAQKLFQILDVDDQNRITVEEFIKGYLQFEADLKKNNDEFNKRFIQEQKNYNNLEEQCRLYKSEKLSPEGFCENAKITVEITDVDIQKEIEGISSVIIKVIYNDKIEKKQLAINSKNNNLIVNEKFEFKPTSRKDRFEFIMITVNEDNVESIIGSKRFPLDQITSQEEYLVQITIPEMEGEEEISAAVINCKIVLFWSDYEFFEEKKKKSEAKLKKIKEASNKVSYYLQKIKEIYGDLKAYELNNFNNNNNINNDINNMDSNDIKLKNNEYQEKRFNINNYSNFTNDNQNMATNFRAKIQNSAPIDNINDPPIEMKINNYQNITYESLPFRGKKAVKFFGTCVLLLGLLGSLKRPDFPNLVLGIFTVLCCYRGINNGLKLAILWFKNTLLFDLLLLIYDFIWLCTHYDFIYEWNYMDGKENLIRILSVICCAVNILIKAVLGALLFKQFNDMKVWEKESNKNNDYY